MCDTVNSHDSFMEGSIGELTCDSSRTDWSVCSADAA